MLPVDISVTTGVCGADLSGSKKEVTAFETGGNVVSVCAWGPPTQLNAKWLSRTQKEYKNSHFKILGSGFLSGCRGKNLKQKRVQ